MRRLLPLALLLVACGPTGGANNTVSDRGAALTTPSDHKVTEPETPTGLTTGGAATTVAIGDNPNRTHQLKDLKRIDVTLKGHPVHLWVMDDDLKQEEGMMFLTDKEVKPDEGMLFAFDALQRPSEGHNFWMHNTLIPLDIIYISPSGKVLNVGHGKIQDDSPVKASGDYQNVIELKAGTAERFGLKPGDTISLPKS